ncbi:hypothetical protein SLU01_01180 [Sporosarcina luteola]|uniref:Uncharacterized protein n=1 Tax=Sporosarcina luteola TaxID=582850 RepID=A0A511Z309_9BACL|nr:hypothetical protein [Sporosarcina luteola]GEN81806.1 hypothetical protein SLU01_01180 [Sporosarcina luteola]
MKKKWKISLAIVVALVLGAGAYLAYILKFKEYDVADEEVAEIVENPYEIELPDGSKLVIDEDGKVSEQNTNNEVDAGDENEGEATSGSTTTQKDSTAGITPPKSNADKTNSNEAKKPSKPSNTDKKLTVADVKGKYEPVFRQLEAQADTKINSLIGRAKKEYSDKKANGESISYGYFYNKYMGAATSLESSTDAVFYGVIEAVEAELVANGYNKSYAKSFIDEYEATKKSRRDGILKKVVGRS